MKKIPVLLSFLLAVLFLGANIAQAVPYSILFDADGSGSSWDPIQIYGWGSDGVKEESINGIQYEIVTHQSLGADNILGNGDTFTESFTLIVTNGLDYSGGSFDAILSTYGWASLDLYIDITLNGEITNYNNGGDGDTTANDITKLLNDTYTSIFTGGSATFYVDQNNNTDYDFGTDIKIGEFSFAGANPFAMDASLFSTGGQADTLAFSFKTDWVNNDFISQAPGEPNLDDLISKGWLLTIGTTTVSATTGILGDDTTDPDQILLGFDITGPDIRLEAVPEPATVLLFGSGLLGLGGFFRRKKS